MSRYVVANRDWLYGLKKGAVFSLIKTEFRNGEGQVVVEDDDGNLHEYPDVFFDDLVPCPDCDDGRTTTIHGHDATCARCGGCGEITEDRL